MHTHNGDEQPFKMSLGELIPFASTALGGMACAAAGLGASEANNNALAGNLEGAALPLVIISYGVLGISYARQYFQD